MRFGNSKLFPDCVFNVAQSFTLLHRRFAIGIASALSRAFELARGPRNAILPSSKVNVTPPNPLPIRWGEGKDRGAGHVDLSGIDHRKCSIPSPHRMGRGALRLSAAAFFRRRTVADWLRCSRLKVCAAIIAFAFAPSDAFSRGATVDSTGRAAAVRSAQLPSPQGRGAGFTQLDPAQTGLRFTNHVSLAEVAKNRLIEDGSGAAAGDVDGDGWCDLYFCNLEGANRLFRNLGGIRFEESTSSPGIRCSGQASTGAALADVDGDSDLDLLVNGLGVGTRLFLNDGRANFREQTNSGLLRDFGARTLALADIEGDGDLDLYVANYRRTTARDSTERVTITRRGNTFEVPLHQRDRFVAEATESGGAMVIELGEPDVFYRNIGNGRFEPIPWTSGAFLDEEGHPLQQPPRDWGLSAMFRDLNGDSLPDLYVCNDFHSPDRIWLNKGKGQFQAAPSMMLRKTSFASMAVDFADINRDGFDDIFVAEMLGATRLRRQTQRDNMEGTAALNFGWGWRVGAITNVTRVMRNTLFLNSGEGTYVEMAQYAGVHASDWTWGAAFLDVDLDGYEDLLIANGHLRDHLHSDVQARLALAGPPQNAAARERLFAQIPSLAAPKRAYRNRGDLTFEERGSAWGFDWTGICNGMALADLDNDGDLDVILNNLNAGALIMRNDSTNSRLAIRVRGRTPNTAALGAKIWVKGGPVPQSQEVISGGRYLSSDDGLRVFAGGQAKELDVEIVWRSGQRSSFAKLQSGYLHELNEPSGNKLPSAPPSDSPQSRLVLFEDVSDRLNAIHPKHEFNDYERQPLLPRKLSQNGPGVSWFDMNGDGHDDLILGAGRGQRMQIWTNDASGNLQSSKTTILSTPTRGDQTAILGWQIAPGLDLGQVVVGLSGYELSTNLPATVGIFSVSSQASRAVGILSASANVGPLAAADLDNDGDLDLFVGGQAEPGRYPVAARSVIFRQTDRRFVEDTENTSRLTGVGLVNGAVWSDLDNDADSDLVLACEWGPIRVFRNTGGALAEATVELGLSHLRGWWNGVAVGDFNADGRMDIVASNWGRNTKHQEFVADELRLYHGDLDGNGAWDVIEAYWDRDLKKEVPFRDFRTMSRAVPSIRERLKTYAAYANASVQEIFGDTLQKLQLLRANSLDSMLFLNYGNRFEGASLPMLAQLTPAFGIAVADYDGDNREDIFLCENSFAADRETGRYDAGRGLLLRGDGTGKFDAMPAAMTGLQIYGEQRNAAVADFDEDGRPDLAVTQHAAQLKLFRNLGGTRGLRVRLVGAVGNPNAIGAQIRLKIGDSYGPTREIHAGSGGGAQDSFITVLARSTAASHIWIRWPDGKITESPLPSHANDISVNPQGEIHVYR